MIFSEGTTGIRELRAEAISDELGGGGGGYETPPIMTLGTTADGGSIPRTMSPEAQQFSASTITGAAASAASSVSTTLSSAASTVSTKASGLVSSVSSGFSGLWAKVTGKDSTPTINLGEVAITAKAPAPETASFTWLWLVLAAGGAYLVYHFTKGKGKGKAFFSKGAASGSHVKRYGK